MNSFKSIKDITSIFPFFSGWISLLMFDQGTKIKKAAENDLLTKLTIMALLTLAYVNNIFVAVWIYLTYFIIRIAFWDVLERISTL